MRCNPIEFIVLNFYGVLILAEVTQHLTGLQPMSPHKFEVMNNDDAVPTYYVKIRLSITKECFRTLYI